MTSRRREASILRSMYTGARQPSSGNEMPGTNGLSVALGPEARKRERARCATGTRDKRRMRQSRASLSLSLSHSQHWPQQLPLLPRK